MKRQKRNLQRALSLALSVLLVFGDGSLLKVSAAERTVSGSDVLTEQTDTGRETGQKEEAGQERNRLPASGTEERAADRLSVSMGDMTVSGNKPVRAPEAFHTEPAPEDYGTLAAYDEYSRTYHVDGSQYVTVIGNDGATYLEEDGSLQPVDNTLVENPVSAFSSIASGDSYVNSANDYTVVLPGTMSAAGEEIRGGAGTQTNGSQGSAGTVSGNENAGSDTATVSGNQPWQQTQAPVFTGDSIVIDNGTHMLSLRPTEGLFEQGVVKDNAIRYNNVFENIDYQYTVLGNAVKEDIILLAPTERNRFSYLLDTYGLSAKIENNTLYVTDGEETAFVLEAPEMEDAAGEISFGVKMELTEQDGSYLVTVTADQDWLCAPERVYPVRIDPTAIQVTKNAIHVACAEEGSPNSVIGDNQYPYVGYDDGITSGNLAGFGSKHLNCRSYFAIDYDFSALAAEAEIKTAAFQVTQKTRWSRGTSEFGLYGVEEEWAVKKLSWNSQTGYTHYFLDSQTATAQRGVPLTYDVTEEVSGWINGTGENHGLVMKAMVEAPNEAAAAAGVKMQSEVFYNNSSASYAPKLIISWTGELTDLDGLTLDDTTIDIYPVVERNGDKSCNTLGVAAHGLAKPGSTVHYQLINGTTGEVEAAKSLKYPDSSEYAGAFPTALEYKRRLSNWQSEVFDNLTPGQEYYVTAYAEGLLTAPSIPGNAAGTAPGAGGAMGVGATVTSDTFIIYEESALDLIPRIVEHYGVDLNTVMADNRMQDCLTKEGNRIFIRNPRNTAPYTSGNFSEYYRAMIDGLLLGRAENCVFGYEPVNLNTGNFYMEQSDAAIPDIGGDFALTRRYNSKGAAYRGSLGYGWSFAYDERLGELEDGSVVWLKNDGSIVTFTKDGEGYQAPAGCDVSLTEKEDGWVLTESASGLEHAFNLYGLLTGLTDLYGNVTALAYDMDFNLLHITSPSGKQFQVSLDGEKRISSVTLPDGYGVSYAYDEAGNLVQVTDPAGDMRTYMYDDAHRMTGWVDENGHQVIGNVYDSEGRVVSQTDANGEVITLAYEEGQTVSTDAEGNITVYHYDSRYRTTAIDYPDGATEKRSYNGEGYLASMTDRTGVTVTYAYDGNGNLISETRQDGAVRSYTYNEKNLLVSFTDYDGGKTEYGYDEKNRPVAVTDAEGGVTAYAYDDSNRLVSSTDPNGGVTAFTYEGACVTSMTDPEGGVWSYTYDAMNRQTGVTNPLGGTSAKAYNLKGWCVAETDEAGAVTSYAFDKAGNVLSVTDKEGQTSAFTYDKKNQMLSGRDPLGNVLAYTYDRNGNKRMEWDAEGQGIKYEYDSLNRLVSQTDPEGQVITFTYNGHDQVTGKTDRRGFTERTAYDNVKSTASSVTDKRGNVTVYETDACGRTTKVTYADGSMVSYGYDQLGRMVSVTDQLGTITQLSYDRNGNLISIQDDASRVYTYAYDRLNRLVKTTDPLGHTVTYAYDALGNVAAVTDGRGNTTSYAYDAVSRLTEVMDALEGRSAYTYDKEDRVLTAAAPGGEQIAYTYDAIGQLLGVTDALGGVTTYTYDGVSRLTSVTDALMGVTAYTYDKNGSLLTRTDALGNAHSYQVNAEGSLLTDRYPNGEKESYTYGCDNIGLNQKTLI